MTTPNPPERMDDFQSRAIGNLRKRHEDRITESAESIRAYAGYVLKRIQDGRPGDAGGYAQHIEADVRRILLSVVALETLNESDEIMAAGDWPAGKAEQ